MGLNGGAAGSASSALDALNNLAQFLFTPMFVQTFVLTFLAEWGDRSQIATIALAAAEDVVGVSLGASIAHCMCTGAAVLGGRFLAAKISVRTVTLVGGFIFLGFALTSLLISYYGQAMESD
jgi:putative Ca2+/H+ antiporter (TMEM165/GDT1 family)